MIAAAGINWWAVTGLIVIVCVAAFVVVAHGCGHRLDARVHEIHQMRDDFVDHVAWQYRDQPGDAAWVLTERLSELPPPDGSPPPNG